MFNKTLYPIDWLTRIRPEILTRDQNKCKNCEVENYSIGAWSLEKKFIKEENIKGLNSDDGFFLFGGQGYPNIIKIVLTIAHLDHDTDNNDYENLAALCQRCHLKHDREDNLKKRKAKAYAKSLFPF